MIIKIRETTEGSNQKEYTYRVKRVTLPEPRIVELKNGETITYRYDTSIEKHYNNTAFSQKAMLMFTRYQFFIN